WFPLQRPITAVPLLLAAGRVWRLASQAGAPEDAEEPQAPAPSPGWAWARVALLVVVLGLLAWPELPRYRAERELRSAQGAFRFVLTRTKEVSDPPAALRNVAAAALDAARALPGDPRGLAIAAGTKLAGSEPDQAIALYREALATGERAELDLNVGRAYDALARNTDAAAWFVRGGWVSPPLLTTLLPDVAAAATAEVARLEAELRGGRLQAPPPMP